MRCFACDRPLTSPELDIPTGRYYCYECLSPTFAEQLRSDKSEKYLLENSHLVTTDLETFFKSSTPDEEQLVLEQIWNGEYSGDN